MKSKIVNYLISVTGLVLTFYILINVFNIKPIVGYVIGGVGYVLLVYFIQKRNLRQ